jgi:hypothetical protein
MFNLLCSAELGCSYILVLIKKENVISRVLTTLSLHTVDPQNLGVVKFLN